MNLENNNGLVVQILYDKYIIMTDNLSSSTIIAEIKGSLRKETSKIFVGDIVDYEKSYDKWIITQVHERGNEIIRPPVSNINQMILMVSLESPKPDYLLLDKELVFCFSHNIKPIICVNKIDLVSDNKNNKDVEHIDGVYSKLGVDIIYFSVKKNINMDELENTLKSKITAFSGNSGVGKSSTTEYLLNKYSNRINIDIGEISERLNKGKHTTKHVRLYVLDKELKTYILDTPGFSSYELYDVDYNKLKYYYPEFTKYKCKYDNCSHINENILECEIKRQVELKNIDENRYLRYTQIYAKLKELDSKKYK